MTLPFSVQGNEFNLIYYFVINLFQEILRHANKKVFYKLTLIQIEINEEIQF